MRVSLKKFVGAAAVASLVTVSLSAQQAQGQAQGQAPAQAAQRAGGSARRRRRGAKELERSRGIRSLRSDHKRSHSSEEARIAEFVERKISHD